MLYRQGLIPTVFSLLVVSALMATTTSNSSTTIQKMNQMPLAFTKNMGQWDDRVLFRANAGGATMWFTKTGVTYQFARRIPSPPSPLPRVGEGWSKTGEREVPFDRPDDSRDSIEQLVLTAKFVGANANPEVVAECQMEYKCNYFLGNEASKWHTDVPNYEAITLKDIYPGIDLKYSGDGNGQAAYEFIVAPGADIAQVKVAYEGVEETSIDADGRMVVRTKWGDMIAAIKTPTNGVLSGTGSFSQLSEKKVGFETNGSGQQALGTLSVGLVYSTYLGGGGDDTGWDIAVDGSGNVYVTGTTGSDVFVTKLSSSGNSLVYSTYLGGSCSESGYAITLDASGASYVTGQTCSSDFPRKGAFQSTYGGGYSDAFVIKLSSAGNSLTYSTYLGGGDLDAGWGIAVDDNGNAYMTGRTLSSNFPTLNPYQAYQGPTNWSDAFVAKLSSTGNSLIYSTYLGGGGGDEGYGIAVDGSGNAYATGWTSSSNFPTLNPYQTTYQGNADVFVTKLSSTGTSLAYSTYLGGGWSDYGRDIAIDGGGNAYVTGLTWSSNFPTLNPYQATLQGQGDAFVTKLSSTGSSLIYSTYLGGSGAENDQGGGAIAVDGSGQVYVTGWTESSNFPTLNPFQGTFRGGVYYGDAFVTKFSSSGNSLIYSTYLGGGDDDQGWSITVDGSGYAYVTGMTNSSNFPTQNPYQGTFQGGYYGDAFVTKLSAEGGQPLMSGWRYSISTGFCLGYAIIQLLANHPFSPYGWEVIWFSRCELPFDTVCIGEGIIPGDVDRLQVSIELNCPSQQTFREYILAAEWINGRWVVYNLGVWVHLQIGRAQLDIPFVLDTLGTYDTLYAVVNLDKWIADQHPSQSSYNVVNGECAELPGFLFGTTPIEFDSLAGADQNPFSTTPVSGTVWLVGNSGLISDYLLCGDANGDGSVDISDVVYLIAYIFAGGSAPSPLLAGDANCDHMVDISDVVYLIAYIFSGGSAPCAGC